MLRSKNVWPPLIVVTSAYGTVAPLRSSTLHVQHAGCELWPPY